MSQPNWTWSQPHQDYYYVTYGLDGVLIYTWAKGQTGDSAASQQATGQAVSFVPEQHKRADSVSGETSIYFNEHSSTTAGHAPYQHTAQSQYAHAATPNTMASYTYPTNSQHQPSIGSYHQNQPAFGNQISNNGFGYQPAANEPAMPDPVPMKTRQLPNFISGTPSKGWYEPLDSSYRMRTGTEARQFFVKGKVFAMLYSQATTSDQARAGDDKFSIVQYGEYAFSQIRRFVVVVQKRGHVLACPITTYSRRATLKGGCDPEEHSIVYFSGTMPQCLPGEDGMNKEPIQVNPADSSLTMDSASRIHFGKAYLIEWNVKVKDIGNVVNEDMSKLLAYYWEHNGQQDGD